jgi:hypothetical protein
MKEKIIAEFDDLADLLARKKSNLAMQARLREESKELDIAIARHPKVAKHVKLLNNTGGSARVDFDDYDFDIKVDYRVKRDWDQDLLGKIHAEGKIPNNLFPFEVEYKESKKDTTTLAEQHPQHYQKLTEALTTQISDRPYVSFLSKRKK